MARREVGTITAGILAAAMMGALALPAQAQNKLEFSANVAATTDYVFRGISQTLNDPALQGGIDASYGIFYVGFWGSNVDFGAGDPADVEFDWYGGITPSWKFLSFDFGVIFYTYPDTGPGYDVTEAKLGVSTTLGENLGIGFTAYLSDRHYQAYEFSAGYDFSGKVLIFTPAVSGQVGFVETNGSFIGTAYTYWNAGLTLAFLDKPTLSIDLRYWDTDLSTPACGGSFCDERFVATLKAAF